MARDGKKPHGRDSGHASIDLGPLVGAFTGGGGASVMQPEGPPTALGEMPAPVMGKAPGFWQNFLTRGQAGMSYADMANKLQLAQYLQNQASYRQNLGHQQAIELGDIGTQQDIFKAAGMPSNPEVRSKAMAEFVPYAASIGKNLAQTSDTTTATGASEAGRAKFKSGVLGQQDQTPGGQADIIAQYRAMMAQPAVSNKLAEAQAKRQGQHVLGSGDVLTTSVDDPLTAKKNQPDIPAGFTMDADGKFVATPAKRGGLEEYGPDGTPIKIRPKAAPATAPAEFGDLKSGAYTPMNGPVKPYYSGVPGILPETPQDLSSLLAPTTNAPGGLAPGGVQQWVSPEVKTLREMLEEWERQGRK